MLLGYYILGLGANFCFKEGGTDAVHRGYYFIGGNLLGITSTALLMGVYARMNVNLALVLATSGAFLLQQGSFWLVFHTPLTVLQAGGILLVGAGTVLASLKPAERGTLADTVCRDCPGAGRGVVMKLPLILVLFWAMQIFANVAFKWGSSGSSGRSQRWLAGFIGGNVVGASSIYFLMLIYAFIPANSNLAAVLAGSGGFVGSQLLLAVLFRSRLAAVQWAGIALVAVGVAVTTLGGPAGHSPRSHAGVKKTNLTWAVPTPQQAASSLLKYSGLVSLATIPPGFVGLSRNIIPDMASKVRLASRNPDLSDTTTGLLQQAASPSVNVACSPDCGHLASVTCSRVNTCTPYGSNRHGEGMAHQSGCWSTRLLPVPPAVPCR